MRRTLTFEVAFAADAETRTLRGVLLPFGAVSRPTLDAKTGRPGRFSFAEGTVTLPDPADVILNYGHDNSSLYMQVGVATELSAQPDGVHAAFKVARTPEGDRVLALADDGVLKAFSAEVEGDFAEPDRDGVQRAKATTVTGAAVVPRPAFVGAQITSVAASAAPEKENSMKCEKCGVTHAEGVTECAQPVTFSATDVAALTAQVQAMAERIADMEKIKIPVGPGTAQFTVTEEPIYRFGGTTPAPSGFDFATDLAAAGLRGDTVALARLTKFTAERLSPRFADQPTTSADVAAVNPAAYRPDMFLGQAPTPVSPLYDCFHIGGLPNISQFFWAKLDRDATDVGVADHTEDVNPEARDLVTAVGATVTPAPVSGRVHITREVADQGGNPVVSALIWNEFERSFKIALETKTAALINAASITELGGTIAAGADGTVAGAAVEQGLVGLQFLDDGYRFERVFGHVDLYKALAAATKGDDNADKMYPILAPTNATGQSASKWSRINIGGFDMIPAARLGATGVNQKSIVADPGAVHVWNSGLTRLDKLSETVAGWDMGVFAYWAGIVYDVTGLRKITYDATA
ncbi:hypothetical protein BN12_40052 [Nostocoides japonicum T1-X7]|uniref:Uncharacterized protein n=1 Tax=Nostocoides japonicum T1-X7 TaxID=1194083 RepID=A0A077M1Z5_9MICO|nr:hypothetical protein [Tetrasphaera japonica]CCH79082.1 hypothetical protein BN12_40052 [Tetrasphaera japonica T1-X7]